MEDTGSRARARRQERVTKVVWGSLFVVMGVLFTLHDMGRINLGQPRDEYAAHNAVDGDPQTRWSSAFRDPQWLTVDLGIPAHMSRIQLNWEAAYAKDYELQTSDDGSLWTTARRVVGSAGGVEEHELDATARYVRVNCMRRATPYGYSLWELKVLDSTGANLSQGKTATASSTEDESPFALWLRFWPLLLVASGLPLLLAPRDDTNQVVGVAFTAVGIFLELQALGRVPWGLRQTSSLVLVLVGVVILLQAQRRTPRGDEDPSRTP